ncbi:unnamed protein product [Ambrosiozyma monospora]|uniref:Unnamed protein product n=1 Tax=Ambrosiozyma monospora TaxID=43982 RepID=A0A9W6YZ52_AMBMO|nr:unnamed protein product [Ambrosiozyma monospora]
MQKTSHLPFKFPKRIIRSPYTVPTLKNIFPDRHDFKHDKELKGLTASRVDIIKAMLPQKYRIDDNLLQHCILKNSDNIDTTFLPTRLKDQQFAQSQIRVQLHQVSELGFNTFKGELYKYAFEEEQRKNKNQLSFDQMDLFTGANQLAAKLNTRAVRRTFIEQFQQSTDSLRSQKIRGKNVSIKIVSETRHTLLFDLTGFIHLQLGPIKCHEFIREFVILGNQSQVGEYQHMGLKEIAFRNVNLY